VIADLQEIKGISKYDMILPGIVYDIMSKMSDEQSSQFINEIDESFENMESVIRKYSLRVLTSKMEIS